MYKQYFSGFTKAPILLIGLFIAVALPLMSLPEITNASITNTRLDAWGKAEGDTTWASNSGVQIYSNGSQTGVWDPDANPPAYDVQNYSGQYNCYPLTGGAGGNGCATNTVPTGIKWQCVELFNRFLMAQGWITSRWAGNGNTLKDAPLPTGFSTENWDAVTFINPGDAITFDGNVSGHVVIVTSVSGSTVNVASQNTQGIFWTVTWNTTTHHLSQTYLGNTYSMQAIIHHPGGLRPTPTGTATSSQITPDGVQHTYTGNSTGGVYDISWGNGSPLTQWQPTSLGASVTSMSSQIVGGVTNIYAAVGAKIYNISWGNGSPLTVWQVTTLSGNINSINSQIVGGVTHVYAAVGATVQDTYWGGGYPVTTWTPATLSATIATIGSQLVGGVTHIYSGVNGTLVDTSYGNGAPLTTWQVANLGSNVLGLTAQQIAGVQQLDAITSTGVSNTSWGNGAPLTTWGIDSVSGGTTYTAINSQMVAGVQHVYAGTSDSTVRDISWGNGSPLTVWVVGSSLGTAVVGLTPQLVSGVQQVDTITSSIGWNISWGNGSPLAQWQVATTL